MEGSKMGLWAMYPLAEAEGLRSEEAWPLVVRWDRPLKPCLLSLLVEYPL